MDALRVFRLNAFGRVFAFAPRAIGVEMLLSILAKVYMCVFINQSKNIKVCFKNIVDR